MNLDDRFINDVKIELQRARNKFPSNRRVLTALTEEVGELSQAMLDRCNGKQIDTEVWMEAVQVAAMALRVATEGDPNFDYNPRSLH